MSNTLQNEQLSLKENPENVKLVKDSKTDNSKSESVTFTPKTIEYDTAELNRAITQGYEVKDYVRTETGIVYILTKWGKANTAWLKPDDSEKSSSEDLKGYYDALFREDKK
jgi:hypothetical protein